MVAHVGIQLSLNSYKNYVRISREIWPEKLDGLEISEEYLHFMCNRINVPMYFLKFHYYFPGHEVDVFLPMEWWVGRADSIAILSHPRI